EILFLLKTFFFVYLGVSIQFSDRRYIWWALAFCAAIYLARLIIVRFALSPEIATWQDLSGASLMVPKGLVSAVLAGIPIAAGIPGAESVRDLTYMVVLVSITLTAVFIPLIERKPLRYLYRGLYSAKPHREPGLVGRSL